MFGKNEEKPQALFFTQLVNTLSDLADNNKGYLDISTCMIYLIT